MAIASLVFQPLGARGTVVSWNEGRNTRVESALQSGNLHIGTVTSGSRLASDWMPKHA